MNYLCLSANYYFVNPGDVQKKPVLSPQNCSFTWSMTQSMIKELRAGWLTHNNKVN